MTAFQVEPGNERCGGVLKHHLTMAKYIFIFSPQCKVFFLFNNTASSLDYVSDEKYSPRIFLRTE